MKAKKTKLKPGRYIFRLYLVSYLQYMLKCEKRLWVIFQFYISAVNHVSELYVEFFSYFHTQWLHTAGCRTLIDPTEQSIIELETRYGSSFCTLSGEPREDKRLRCIQNKEMGGTEHLSWRGGRWGVLHPPSGQVRVPDLWSRSERREFRGGREKHVWAE